MNEHAGVETTKNDVLEGSGRERNTARIIPLLRYKYDPCLGTWIHMQSAY
jgi:hypothetical protein